MGANYSSVAEFRAYFSETFNMLDDFEKNIDLLLKHGFVEANNRLDYYTSSVDSIKITGYGAYMFNNLAFLFTYLDLVCTDTGIYDESVNNYLVEAARSEYSLFMKGDKVERVKRRLERVEKFVKYLKEEELRERDVYSLGMQIEDMFTSKCEKTFNSERVRVLESAQRQNFKLARRRPRFKPTHLKSYGEE